MEGTLAFTAPDQCDSSWGFVETMAAENSRRSWKVEDASSTSHPHPTRYVFLLPPFPFADQAPRIPEDKAREPVLQPPKLFLFAHRAR